MTDPNPKRTRHRAHGTGSILELGTNRFRLGFDCAAPGEKRKQRFETFHGTKSAAKTHLASLIDAARRGGTAHDDAITFAQLAERFIAAKTISREATTVHLYARTLRCHVLPAIGAIKVRKLTANHITKMMSGAIDTSPRKKTRGQKLGPTSQRSLRTLVSSILEFGIKTDCVIRNVAKMTEVPASAHREHVKFSVADVEAFIGASARTPLGVIIVFAIGSGLRRGELCGLRWSDIDLETGIYTLQRSAKNLNGKAFVGKLKTAKSRRTDHLTPFVVKALKQHRIEQIERHLALGIRPLDGGFVFDDPTGEMIDPNELSAAFGAFVRAKGLRHVRLHDLRHGYATLGFAAGVPLKTISESLGHSSIGITSSIYVDVLDPAKVEKSNAIDSYLGAAVAKGLRSGTTDA
jgi:integrase